MDKGCTVVQLVLHTYEYMMRVFSGACRTYWGIVILPYDICSSNEKEGKRKKTKQPVFLRSSKQSM